MSHAQLIKTVPQRVPQNSVWIFFQAAFLAIIFDYTYSVVATRRMSFLPSPFNFLFGDFPYTSFLNIRSGGR